MNLRPLGYEPISIAVFNLYLNVPKIRVCPIRSPASLSVSRDVRVKNQSRILGQRVLISVKNKLFRDYDVVLRVV